MEGQIYISVCMHSCNVVLHKHNYQNIYLLLFIQEHKQLLVGFQSYIHGYNRTSRLYYLENRMSHRPSIGKNRTTYSLVLTTGFFINLFYLRMYTDLIPDTIKLFVDTKFNGEDIVMNFMVAQHLYEETRAVQTSCLWVQGTAFHLEWSASKSKQLQIL